MTGVVEIVSFILSFEVYKCKKFILGTLSKMVYVFFVVYLCCFSLPLDLIEIVWTPSHVSMEKVVNKITLPNNKYGDLPFNTSATKRWKQDMSSASTSGDYHSGKRTRPYFFLFRFALTFDGCYDSSVKGIMLSCCFEHALIIVPLFTVVVPESDLANTSFSSSPNPILMKTTESAPSHHSSGFCLESASLFRSHCTVEADGYAEKGVVTFFLCYFFCVFFSNLYIPIYLLSSSKLSHRR